MSVSSYKKNCGVENRALMIHALITSNFARFHELEKFIGCVIASYRSILSATRTYVDAYVTKHWINLINLHAKLPACHVTVIRHIMSVRTFNRPTLKSVDEKKIIYSCRAVVEMREGGIFHNIKMSTPPFHPPSRKFPTNTPE